MYSILCDSSGFPYRKGPILVFLEHVFMFFRAPELHNEDEEVNRRLGQVSEKQVKLLKKVS